MPDQNGNGAEAPQTGPKFSVLAQYTKDLSFENPNAPRTLGPQQTAPNISIQVNVNAKPLTAGDIEVELLIEGKAGDAPNLVFAFEIIYGGVFRMQNIPQENVHPVDMIECPRLLFPFAREVLAKSTRDGGYPPVMLNPIDFLAVFREQIRRREAEAGGAKPALA